MERRMKRTLASALALAIIAVAPPAFSQAQGGTTSGPAAGTPATLGNNGASPTSPHQTEVLRDKGGQATQGETTGSSAPAQVGTTGSQPAQSNCSGQNCQSQ